MSEQRTSKKTKPNANAKKKFAKSPFKKGKNSLPSKSGKPYKAGKNAKTGKRKANDFKEVPDGAWQVKKTDAEFRMNQYIANQLINKDGEESEKSALSLRQIKNLVEKGLCSVNGKIETFASRKLRPDDIVLFRHDQKIVKEKRARLAINASDILFEDEDIIAYHKPAGFACGPTDVEDLYNIRDFLNNYLNEKNDLDIQMVHRLDKDTSGVLLFAKNKKSCSILREAFRLRKIFKVYETLVDGKVEEESESITSKLIMKSKGKGWEKWGVTQSNKGKNAETHYEVKKRFGHKATLLKIFPKTGRTHQIRVHMNSLGHPVLGDMFYAKEFRCKLAIGGHLLHASELHFDHPITGKRLRIKAPLPKRFKDIIKQLRQEISTYKTKE